jgi:hypothetical protein
VHSPNATHWTFATLVAVLGAQGKSDEGGRLTRQLRALSPDYSSDFARREFGGIIRDEFVEIYVNGLRAAGL